MTIHQFTRRINSLDLPLAKNFINEKIVSQIGDWEQIDIELLKKFKQLNETGKAIAIERIEELTEIPRYTQKESNVPDKED